MSKAMKRVGATIAIAVALGAGSTGPAAAQGTGTVLDTLGPVAPTTQFSVFGSWGQPVAGGSYSVGPTFTINERTKLTEVGAFLNNCASIIMGVPQCPQRQPFVVEIHRVKIHGVTEGLVPPGGAVQPFVIDEFPLSDDNDPLLVSYESAAPNIILEPGTYVALITAQGTDGGWVLGGAQVPFSYLSESTQIAVVQPGLSYLTHQYLGMRILGEAATPGSTH
jgi:hypothetical protein